MVPVAAGTPKTLNVSRHMANCGHGAKLPRLALFTFPFSRDSFCCARDNARVARLLPDQLPEA
jgi:hypothetical protein